MKSLLLFVLAASVAVLFGHSQESFGIEDPLYHPLEIDGHEFEIPYKVQGDVLAMAIDQELTSLLIGLENTHDSVMMIELNHELISAEGNGYAVLVNGFEVDYSIETDFDSSTLSFFVPAFSEEVEIIGTHVIPEFPLGVLIVFGAIVSSVVLVSKTKLSFKW